MEGKNKVFPGGRGGGQQITLERACLLSSLSRIVGGSQALPVATSLPPGYLSCSPGKQPPPSPKGVSLQPCFDIYLGALETLSL